MRDKDPNPELQNPNRFQYLNSKMGRRRQQDFALVDQLFRNGIVENWSLELIWILEFGIWSFPLGCPYVESRKKPALFLPQRCYLRDPMSRFALIILSVLTGSTALLAQGPAAPAVPAGVTPAVPLQVTPPGATPAAPAQDPNALKWSAESIDYNAKPGEQSAPFTFIVTNVSNAEISINSLRTSCGCTVAQLPTTPYKLAPGSNVPISVTMDLRGKSGAVTKSVSVDTSAGFKSLLVKVNIPDAAPATAATPGGQGMDRAKNIQTALADRQAVFKGECASCHVEKGKGKMGQELYAASCGICHDAEHRAAMVTDLKVPRTERDLAFWQKWIMEGKPGTMMPAFAQIHGGPLTQEQIDSLTVYLFQNYPRSPKVVAATPKAAPVTISPSVTLPPAPPAKN